MTEERLVPADLLLGLLPESQPSGCPSTVQSMFMGLIEGRNSREENQRQVSGLPSIKKRWFFGRGEEMAQWAKSLGHNLESCV